MKMHFRLGFLGLIVASAAVAQADYILDVPQLQSAGFTAWKFRDTSATAGGSQINAWASLEDGYVVFKTDSTIDSAGNYAGVRTFSRFGASNGGNRIVRFDYILDGGGVLMVKALTANGDGVMITPQYSNGILTQATKLTNIGANSAVKVARTGATEDGYEWSYIDCDYILDGPQAMVWVEYNATKGALTFRSDSTVYPDGTAAGVKTINSYGTTGNRVNAPSEVYTVNGKIFAVATTVALGQNVPVVFSPNFNPKQTMAPVVPELAAPSN